MARMLGRAVWRGQTLEDARWTNRQRRTKEKRAWRREVPWRS